MFSLEVLTKSQEQYDLLVPKNGNVNDIITDLIKKARLDDEAKAGPIRIYETHSNKIYKELPRDHAVLAINEYVQLIAERIPEEDRGDVDDLDFIHAFHFQNEPAKSHGMPFKFRVIKDEKFSDTKKRLEKRTGMKGKNFEKIKFAVVKRSSYSKPTYLTDGMFPTYLRPTRIWLTITDDELYSVASQDDDLLGLDHLDRTRTIRNGAGDLFLR